MNLLGMDSRRLGAPLARDIQVHVLSNPNETLPALPDGEQPDSAERTEDPDDADRDPAGEERPAEDVA